MGAQRITVLQLILAVVLYLHCKHIDISESFKFALYDN